MDADTSMHTIGEIASYTPYTIVLSLCYQVSTVPLQHYGKAFPQNKLFYFVLSTKSSINAGIYIYPLAGFAVV